METLSITAADGTKVPVYWSPASHPRATLLLLPALGIQAKLYCRLAQGLAARGCATAIMEQRGHGLSTLKPGYGSHYGFDQSLQQDIPAVANWLVERVPGARRLIGGHSLGGHLSTLYTGQHAEEIDGVIHLACAFPYIGDYRGKHKAMLRLLCSLIPLFAIFPGYYPGQLLGFGDRESITMMKQWRQWAVTGNFDFDQHRGLAESVAAYTGPVLSLSFERDDFSTTAAVERALSAFSCARIERVQLGEKEQGKYLGHTRWAQQPDGAVAAIDAWLNNCPVQA